MRADISERSSVEVNRFMLWLQEGAPILLNSLNAERDAVVVRMGEIVAAERIGSVRVTCTNLEREREKLWKLNATIEVLNDYLAGRSVISSVKFIATA